MYPLTSPLKIPRISEKQVGRFYVLKLELERPIVYLGCAHIENYFTAAGTAKWLFVGAVFCSYFREMEEIGVCV